jgi:hypothetical protein
MLSAKSEQCGSLQIVDAPNVRAHANTKSAVRNMGRSALCLLLGESEQQNGE